MQTSSESQPIQSTLSHSEYKDFCSGKDFWAAFCQDLRLCAYSLTIVSPLITNDATWKIVNELKQLKAKGVLVRVYTRPAAEHQNRYGFNLAHARLQRLGVDVRIVSRIKQKLAIIDQFICWEGNMNILGFRDLNEQMRRFQSLELKNIVGDFDLDLE